MKKNFKACWIRLVELNHILARHLNPRSFFLTHAKISTHIVFLTLHQYLIHGNCLTDTIFFFWPTPNICGSTPPTQKCWLVIFSIHTSILLTHATQVIRTKIWSTPSSNATYATHEPKLPKSLIYVADSRHSESFKIFVEYHYAWTYSLTIFFLLTMKK